MRRKRLTRFEMWREKLDAVGAMLAQARSALVISGTGLSVEAGMPVYRNLLGLEKNEPNDAKLIETALSAETFQRNPEMTWKYLMRMEAGQRAVAPSRAHEVIAALSQRIPRTVVLTTATDRLHQRAGSRNVIEMHGALYDLRCPRCELVTRHETFDTLNIPPPCPQCGGVMRPTLAFYGEALSEEPFARLQEELDQGFDIVIAIGIVQMYPYLARPIILARAENSPTVEIGELNSDVSEFVDFRFKGASVETVERIWEVCEAMPTRKPRSHPSAD
ncbi:MAG TPA: Sir2 family NAD-dependent protein deacetylase [Kofleriaceae bacterium]|jgi:NAD-dependent deacetylase